MTAARLFGYTFIRPSRQRERLFLMCHYIPNLAQMKQKQLNFHHGEPEPWSKTLILLWSLVALLAGIVSVLFLVRI
jgi:hypothetical protein